MNKILSVGCYAQYKELCHGVKKCNERALHDAARLLSTITPQGATLVPMPSHYGHATYMLDLALMVAALTNGRVDDCLAGRERISLYQAKKQHIGTDLDMVLTHQPDGRVFFIDNCVDTGMTYNAASMLIQAPMITIANTNNYNYGRNY